MSNSNQPQSSTSPPPPTLTDTNQKLNTNNNSTTKISNGTEHSLERYTSPKHIEIHNNNHHIIDPDHEKRICCTILWFIYLSVRMQTCIFFFFYPVFTKRNLSCDFAILVLFFLWETFDLLIWISFFVQKNVLLFFFISNHFLFFFCFST